MQPVTMLLRFLILTFLVLFKASICHAQMSFNEQLIEAAFDGDTLKVHTLLRNGANVNSRTYDEVTPLMYAAQNGHTPVAELLLRNGAKPDLKSFEGHTALILAINAGHIEMAELLIRDSADINLADKQKVTPLMHAINADSFYMPDMLLHYGANPDLKDIEGKNALMLAAKYGSYEIAIRLLEEAANINAVDNENNTALHYATSGAHISLMELLIVNGAGIDDKNASSYSPLSMAVSLNNYKAVLLLTGYGADVNSKINRTLNPLSIASENMNDSIVRLLKNHGAETIHSPNFNKAVIGAGYSFSPDDSRVGIQFGYSDSRHHWMPALGYGFRPGPVRVLEAVDQTTYYQYRESRHYISVSLDKAFLMQQFGSNLRIAAYCGLGGVLTFGMYKGSSKVPDTRFLLNPKVGALVEFGSVRLKAGYEFMNLRLKTYETNWFNISLEFLINRKRGLVKIP